MLHGHKNQDDICNMVNKTKEIYVTWSQEPIWYM